MTFLQLTIGQWTLNQPWWTFLHDVTTNNIRSQLKPRNHAFSRQNDERNNEPPVVSYHAYMSRCFLQSRLNSAPILQRRSRNYPQSWRWALTRRVEPDSGQLKDMPR